MLSVTCYKSKQHCIAHTVACKADGHAQYQKLLKRVHVTGLGVNGTITYCWSGEYVIPQLPCPQQWLQEHCQTHCHCWLPRHHHWQLALLGRLSAPANIGLRYGKQGAERRDGVRQHMLHMTHTLRGITGLCRILHSGNMLCLLQISA